MGPASLTLVILLVAASVGFVVLVARTGHLAVKVACAALALGLAMLSGITSVNAYYGYYTSWSGLIHDLSGTVPDLGATTAADHRTHRAVGRGRLMRVLLPGQRSGINRSGYVYLPPQYDQPAYSRYRFPVVELFHGSPGEPGDWVGPLRIVRVLDAMLAHRLLGPMVVVMPQIDGSRYQDCVDGRFGADETYLATDVPADVRVRFRVSADPAQWGLGGYSSGGYCSANIAMRHRSSFGAAASMDGYFRAVDGPAAAALGSAQAAAANSPLLVARALSADVHPIPAFWISVGTGDAMDLAEARAFVDALHGIEQVGIAIERGAGHNFYAWSAALPTMLAWLWQQLAPPDLRVQFPVAGPPTVVRVPPALPMGHAGSKSPTPPLIWPALQTPSPTPSQAPSPSEAPSPSARPAVGRPGGPGGPGLGRTG